MRNPQGILINSAALLASSDGTFTERTECFALTGIIKPTSGSSRCLFAANKLLETHHGTETMLLENRMKQPAAIEPDIFFSLFCLFKAISWTQTQLQLKSNFAPCLQLFLMHSYTASFKRLLV